MVMAGVGEMVNKSLLSLLWNRLYTMLKNYRQVGCEEEIEENRNRE